MIAELERKIAFNAIMAVQGNGLGYEAAVISFHENYSSYLELTDQIKQFSYRDLADVQSFIVSLSHGFAYRSLTFATLAKHLLKLKCGKGQ